MKSYFDYPVAEQLLKFCFYLCMIKPQKKKIVKQV